MIAYFGAAQVLQLVAAGQSPAGFGGLLLLDFFNADAAFLKILDYANAADLFFRFADAAKVAGVGDPVCGEKKTCYNDGKDKDFTHRDDLLKTVIGEHSIGFQWAGQ